MEDAQQNPTMTFKFAVSPEYRRAHISGAWGSVTPDLQVAIDLHFDALERPDQSTLVMGPDGRPIEEIAEPAMAADKMRIQRMVEFGAVMTPDVAEGVGRWLIQKAQEARTLEQQHRK